MVIFVPMNGTRVGIRIGFILCFGVLASIVNAQNSSVLAIKLNPFSPLAGRFVVGVEQPFNTKISFGATVGYMGGTNMLFNDTIQNRKRGVFIIPEMRFYPNKSSLEGFYLSTNLRYFTLREQQNDLVFEAQQSLHNYTRTRFTRAASIGGGLGYQGVEKRFVYDFGFAINYNKRIVSYNYQDKTISDYDFNTNRGTIPLKTHDKMGMRVVLNIGYLIYGSNNKKAVGLVYNNERAGIAQRY